MTSQRLWAICKEFKVLPNDPRFLELEEGQVDWIQANMARDMDIMRDNLPKDKNEYDAEGLSKLNFKRLGGENASTG